MGLFQSILNRALSVIGNHLGSILMFLETSGELCSRKKPLFNSVRVYLLSALIYRLSTSDCTAPAVV